MPDCLFYAVQIQRKYLFAEWRPQLAKVPDDCKVECEVYLQSIADRMRAQLKAVRGQGFESVEQHKDFMKEKKKNPLLTVKQYLSYLRNKN